MITARTSRPALARTLLDCLLVTREFGRRQILVEVGDGRSARDQKNVGRAMEQPGKCHLHWSRAEPCCDL